MKIISQLKRVPNVLILIPLILIAGIAEGIGLTVLVPVVSTLTKESQINELPGIFKYFEYLLNNINPESQFTFLLTLALIFMILAYFLVFIQEKAIFMSRYTLLRRLRNRLSKSIIKSKWERISELSSGDISNSIIHESERGAEALLGLVMIMATSFQLIVYGIFAAMLSWQMFLISLIVISLGFIITKRIISRVKKLGKKSADKNNELSQFIVDFIRGSKLFNTIFQKRLIH